ncbi:asparagine synthase-related protein [Streptomyces sp. NPDC003036]|uniref:asparagine synthase-related protein n=1 Tax=Streptomyces sp. NPDC003036 TaxID=3154442 RepID=UPI0033B750A1
MNPLDLSGPVPGVDLYAVGLLLAPPALTGEFYPVSLWRGVERLPVRPFTPVPHPGGLRAAFAESVRSLTEHADTIGVALSGGLDSLATLLHVCEIAGDRRVIAFTGEQRDDQGRSCVPVVRRLLSDLGLEDRVRLVVIDPERHRAQPVWSPVGPRLDSLPEVNAALSETAHRLGVDVLLSGVGSDELLGVPRYATGEIARRYGARAAWRYLRDVGGSGPGTAGEAAAVLARLAPAGASARAYWAVNWPEWTAPTPSPALAEPYRSYAAEWGRAWVEQRIASHAAEGRSWAHADAFDAFWPHEVIGQAGPVPEASPFLTEGFLSAAFAVPLAARYRPDAPTAYWRCKWLVLSLMPRRVLPVLPRRKAYYTAALAREATALDARAPLLSVECGLIDRSALAREKDTAFLMTLSAVEQWLLGARERGAVIG